MKISSAVTSILALDLKKASLSDLVCVAITHDTAIHAIRELLDNRGYNGALALAEGLCGVSETGSPDQAFSVYSAARRYATQQNLSFTLASKATEFKKCTKTKGGYALSPSGKKIATAYTFAPVARDQSAKPEKEKAVLPASAVLAWMIDMHLIAANATAQTAIDALGALYQERGEALDRVERLEKEYAALLSQTHAPRPRAPQRPAKPARARTAVAA